MTDLEEIKLHLKDELKPSPKERGKYLCPLCGSGTHGAGSTAALSIKPDGIHWKCFSCDAGGDIVDLVSARDGVSASEATKKLIAKYAPGGGAAAHVRAAAPPKQEKTQEDPPQRRDFSALITSCHSALKGSPGEAYLLRRGFTEQTMDRFNLGYGTDLLRRPCIVIPHDKAGTYYATRTVDDNADPKHMKPAKVPAILFNAAALWQDSPCFMVESQLCAISIMQEGGSAVALGGTSGKDQLITLLGKKAPSGVLILSLDNDDPGQKVQAEIAEALAERSIPYIEMNIAGTCKDPNELLQKDAAALRQNVSAAVAVANATRETIKQNDLEEYESRTTAASFADFEKYLTANANRPPVPTGFTSLDRILNGGLSAGLYVMGAISSLGKTSWMLNIADNIAASGRDVLYFSLEMSRYELIAKSISRLSFVIVSERKSDVGEACTTFEVLNSRNRSFSTGQSSVLPDAMRRYRETIGKHMWIFSGISSISTDEITQKVEEHIRITGRTPVVFVDYLQILAPEDARSTDKQNTDRAVVKLKTMSAAHDIPVFCISSLNRSNYSEPINMAAFKESGAIEYGSDVLIGIQLYGIERKKGEKDNDRAVRLAEIIKKAEEDPQIELEVKILKNRNGQRGGSGKLIFDKKYNWFDDMPDGFTRVSIDNPFDDEEEEPAQKKRFSF